MSSTGILAARPRVSPTGVERSFSDDEIIVSKTDAHGRITYVNDVFVRVSGYSRAELTGAAHSVIRHPDMPRAVFALLWSEIAAGRELFAYVLNLGADGGHYWVFAHVTPTRDGAGRIAGYHSNRRTAPRRAVATIAPIYHALRVAERRVEQGGGTKRDAVAASTALLDSTLAAAGQSYDEFVWGI